MLLTALGMGDFQDTSFFSGFISAVKEAGETRDRALWKCEFLSNSHL